MAEVVRSDYPAMPTNPQASMGAVGNVVGSEKPVIRPEYPATPMNPQASMGSVGNVGGGANPPVVRGGTSGPTG